MKKLIALTLFVLIAFASCKKDTTNTTTTTPPATTPAPQLRFVFKFDSTQARLGSFGQADSVLPANHRAQNPHFNGMSSHYIELTPNANTQVGAGTVIYVTPATPTTAITVGTGSAQATYTNAIEFNQESVVGQGGQFFSIPLSQVTAGKYQYLRISVAYQNYDIRYGIAAGTTVSGYTFPSNYPATGTIASFIGYYTQIGSYTIKTQNVSVNACEQQGYWGFESAPFVIGGHTYTVAPSWGQAPEGATTVVNPLFATSAVKAGSCLVTGRFVNPSGATDSLTITGHETSDIVITVSMSTNKSFEWSHSASSPDDGRIYPGSGDSVVNMGVRGMKPILPN
jgi:hypothetical protein